MDALINVIAIMINLGSVSTAVISPASAGLELIAPYEGNLRPLDADRTLFNEVTNTLTFEFREIGGVIPTTSLPVRVTAERPPIANVLSIYDNAKEDLRQRKIYITFDTENAKPPIVRGAVYALKISGIPVALFSKYVKLFTIWLLRNNVNPTWVATSWSVFDFSTGINVTGGLYIVFQVPTNTVTPYNYAEQMVIIDFNAIATSATYVDTRGPGSTTQGTVLVTLTSEIFTTNTESFVGGLSPVNDFDLLPFHRFVPYWGYPTQQMIALARLNKFICNFAHTGGISRSDFNAMSRISAVFTSRCCIIKRCCKKSTREYCKPDILKYFAFVCCSLRCLPKLECCPKYLRELDNACRSSEDCASVFTTLLLKMCVNMGVDASYHVRDLFDTVTGYNPFCCPGANVHSLSDKDAGLVAGSFGVEAEAEVEVIEEVECIPEEKGRGRVPKPKRDSFTSRYKWHITVAIAVAVVASVSAFMI